MQDKIVLITGGSKGIGRACVMEFLNEGYTVVDASRTNVPVNNPSYHYRETDVSSEESIKRLFDFVIEKFGRLDVLINNAGISKFANLSDSLTEDFDAMFAVNVRGVYLCARYALKLMIPQNSGDIINIASIAGKTAIQTASIYCATKHAVMAISKTLMLEVRKHNIRVAAICPGSVDTDFFNQPGSILNSERSSILSPADVSAACMLIVKSPVRALINEIELRPTNHKKI